MFDSLHSFSDQQILSRTDALVVRDRKLTLSLLVHLRELERRKLYLVRGYGSMFDYCTKHFRFSEPAAIRRLRTARCLGRFPELYAMLESGEVNTTTVSMAARILNPTNKDALLTRIRGKSKREVQAILAEFEPRAVVPRDSVRPIVVPARRPVQADQFLTVAGDGKKSSNVEESAPGDRRAGDPEKSPGATVTAILERRAVIQFAAGEGFLALVDRVRSIASHRLPPNATLEQVFTLAMSEYVRREDPQLRHERREAKQARASASSEKANSRRPIPTAIRDQVFARDRGRCTFVGSNGQRCDAVRHVQVDHIRPVARGGGATVDNLRLLCAQHNRLESERLMGSCGKGHAPHQAEENQRAT